MQLVEAGKVQLDAPVRRYIRWFSVGNSRMAAKITVRQLLYHNSGLPMMREPQLWTEQDDKVLERTVRFLRTAKMNSQPGQSFKYSNANYETLGLIVQIVSGQSYEEYIKQHIFIPLNMQHSFVSQEQALLHGMASGYRWWFGIPFSAMLPYNRSELPAGYIISSAEDISHFLIAEMNGGRYRDSSVLSPDGIALTHTEPAPNTFGMGWESVRINGRTLLNFDGGTANFQCSIFFDPETRVGVFLAANVMCALDAFSSPHGTDPLDGVTARAMAQSVLSMVTSQPLPDQGRGIRQLYVIFDLIILMLTTILLISLMRIPRRSKQLRQQGIYTYSGFLWRSSMIAALHFLWPLFILYLALKVLLWKLLIMMQPDLGYWLEAVAIIVFLKGVLEIKLYWRIFRQTYKKSPHIGRQY